MTSEEKEPTWLDRMHSLLEWKLVGLDFSNPYGAKISDKALAELAANPSALRRYVGLRGLMDGEEILSVENLNELRIRTEHPNLTSLKKAELREYFENSGVAELINKGLEDIQQQCQDEIGRRKEEREREKNKNW